MAEFSKWLEADEESIFSLETEKNLPIAAYVSARGIQIEGNGITPDVSIPWSFENAETGADSQLQGAIDALHSCW